MSGPSGDLRDWRFLKRQAEIQYNQWQIDMISAVNLGMAGSDETGDRLKRLGVANDILRGEYTLEEYYAAERAAVLRMAPKKPKEKGDK